MLFFIDVVIANEDDHANSNTFERVLMWLTVVAIALQGRQDLQY